MIPLSRSSGVKKNPLFSSSFREETLEMIKTYPIPLTKQEIQLLPNFENKNASQHNKIKVSYQKIQNRFLAKLDREPIVEAIEMLLNELEGFCGLNVAPLLNLLRGGEKLFEVEIDKNLKELYDEVVKKNEPISSYDSYLGDHLIKLFAAKTNFQHLYSKPEKEDLEIRIYPIYIRNSDGTIENQTGIKRYETLTGGRRWLLHDNKSKIDYAIKIEGKGNNYTLSIYRDDNHVIEFGKFNHVTGLKRDPSKIEGVTIKAKQKSGIKFSAPPEYRIILRANKIKMLKDALNIKDKKGKGVLHFYIGKNKKRGLHLSADTVIHELLHVFVKETRCVDFDKRNQHIEHRYIIKFMQLIILISKLAANRSNKALKKRLLVLYNQLEVKRVVRIKVKYTEEGKNYDSGPETEKFVLRAVKYYDFVVYKEKLVWNNVLKEGLPLEVKKKLLGGDKVSQEEVEKVFEGYSLEPKKNDSVGDKTIKPQEWNFVPNPPDKQKSSYTIKVGNNGYLEITNDKGNCNKMLNLKECLENLGVLKCSTKTGK